MAVKATTGVVPIDHSLPCPNANELDQPVLRQLHPFSNKRENNDKYDHIVAKRLKQSTVWVDNDTNNRGSDNSYSDTISRSGRKIRNKLRLRLQKNSIRNEHMEVDVEPDESKVDEVANIVSETNLKQVNKADNEHQETTSDRSSLYVPDCKNTSDTIFNSNSSDGTMVRQVEAAELISDEGFESSIGGGNDGGDGVHYEGGEGGGDCKCDGSDGGLGGDVGDDGSNKEENEGDDDGEFGGGNGCDGDGGGGGDSGDGDGGGGGGGCALQDHRLSIWDLKKMCINQFDDLTQGGKIEFSMLGSSQGRLFLYGDPNSDSTDGCSVISGLNISAQISSLDIQEVITNETIVDIIDVQAPPILNEIRKKSKMIGNIDWDTVQDYLLKKKILPENSWFQWFTGNILDKDFIKDKVISTLVKQNEDFPVCKLGVILYFKRHIISILQISGPNGDLYYDLIESLPKGGSGNQGYRARSYGIEYLSTLLRWYAFSRYSDTDLEYIQNNDYYISGSTDDMEYNYRYCQFDFYSQPNINAPGEALGPIEDGGDRLDYEGDEGGGDCGRDNGSNYEDNEGDDDGEFGGGNGGDVDGRGDSGGGDGGGGRGGGA